MLKKEAIKQAIDAIAERDKEIGYSLTELFGINRITVANEADSTTDGGLYNLMFDGQPIPIKKNNYFFEGSAAIEQKLLIQYGEMARRLALATSKTPINYSDADQSIRMAGTMCLVHHEIDLAMDRISQRFKENRDQPTGRPQVPDEVYRLLCELRKNSPKEDFPLNPDAADVLFKGAVDANTPAAYCRFPYTTEALMQVADMDLSFFSVRFILNCLCNGTSANLHTCIVDGRIAGIVYLQPKQYFLKKSLELKYIASSKDARPGWAARNTRHHGVGTFLVAGVWLFWKNMLPEVQEIVLDAEIKALRFYEEIGFKNRRPYVYALQRPAGLLRNALAVMVDRSEFIQPKVIKEMTEMIQTEFRILLRRKHKNHLRDQALNFIKLCLLSRSQERLATTAAALLLKHKMRIPEAESLLQLATCHGRIRVVDQVHKMTHPILIFKDNDMHLHLQGIWHLENANRLRAIQSALYHEALSGKWNEVTARPASIEELGWVHTSEHIARIAATAGKKLVSLDLDTQTTRDSYAVACTAVGGIFSILDGLFSSPSRRAFAAVRPPVTMRNRSEPWVFVCLTIRHWGHVI